MEGNVTLASLFIEKARAKNKKLIRYFIYIQFIYSVSYNRIDQSSEYILPEEVVGMR